jgi:hypothetical protein
MAQPTPKVYLAINQSPYLASPTWTEITSYVMSADTYRGRDNDWQDTQSGTATITLNNNSRIWDPAYTAGTYYGQLIPRMQIKITGTISATEYDVFRGYIAGWPVQYDNAGATSTVTLSCYDALGLLAQDQLPPDWADEYITSLNPFHYYKFNEQIVASNQASTVVYDYGSYRINLTPFAANPAFSNIGQLANGLLGSAINVGNNEGLAFNAGVVLGAASAVTFSGWVTPIDLPYGLGYIAAFAVGGIDFKLVYDYTTSTIKVSGDRYTGGTSGIYQLGTSVRTIDTNVSHHWAFTCNSLGVPTALYLDGSSLPLTSTTSVTFMSNPRTDYFTASGSQQSVAIWASALTSTQIQNIVTLSKAIFYETTSARYARILTYTSFPAGLTSISGTSTAYVSEITDDSPNLTSELQINNRSEGGLCFVSKSGVLTTKSRYEQFSYGYTDQLPLTSTTDTGFDTSINISLDADEMANDVGVTWSNGNVSSVTNTTSVAAYGQKQKPVTTQLSSHSEAISLAEMQTGLGQYPRPKLSEHRVNPANNSTTWANILDLELYERYSLAVAPQIGNATNYTLLMQSVSHRIEPGRWECRFKGSNIYASAFRLDASLLNGPDVLLYAQ